MADRNPLVVMVTYRETESVSEALRLLGGTYDVLVVDNGVEEDMHRVAELHGADYVTPGRNIGFAAAVNVGISSRGRRHVLLLNPDARVSPSTVDRLVAELEATPRLCAVAPSLVDETGRQQQVEWPVPSPKVELVKAFRLQRLFRARETFVIGAVLLLRAEALDDIGLFDERFFLYAEESDWQLRALRRGWSVKEVEGLQAAHDGGGSGLDEKRQNRYFYESAALFGLKWYGRTGWTIMRAASLLGASVRLALTAGNPQRRTRYARQLRR